MIRKTIDPSHTEVQRLAYHFWEERGRPWGSADEDWFRAERELYHRLGSSFRHQLDYSTALPFSSIALGPSEQ